jgi:hypothetical protein
VYLHRCEEDGRIQTALWAQMVRHLNLLYNNDQKLVWHCIRHLSFKMECAALQEKSRWKLDVPKCTTMEADFSKRFDEAKDALVTFLPKVPKYAIKTRPKKCFKMDGELSAIGGKWYDLCEEHGKDFRTFIGEIKVVAKYDEPNAGSHSQIKKWLFSIGWVPETYEFKRNKETNEVKKIPQVKVKDTGELCPSIERLIATCPEIEHLREMSIVKHRGDICRTFLKYVDDEGYIQALIQGFTNTLRFKHKVALNLPSDRKKYGAELRGLLTVEGGEDGDTELCGSDLCSLEDRTKQHYMWPYDPKYVKDMMKDDFDPHIDMAQEAGIMTHAQGAAYKAGDFSEWSKKYLAEKRFPGKSTNYAATYGAGGPTIARSAGVPEAVGEKLFKAYWRRNWSLKAIADNASVKSSRGLNWVWNPVAQMWIWLKNKKDVFSTLNQSTGTYIFDIWLQEVIKKRPQLTAQFHDEVILEVKKGKREECTKMLKDAMEVVNKRLKLNRDMDCDVEFSHNYAGIH